jgi:hypothetical protein
MPVQTTGEPSIEQPSIQNRDAEVTELAERLLILQRHFLTATPLVSRLAGVSCLLRGVSPRECCV